ncbi:response regulator transcription factor [Roseomonas sp. USHLN139]|uniref:response regulator transcription factor n=1 Tax=Roseomonas sp. USHLN139 TaxID=3081298 RepID=UPI003B013B05
MPAAKDSETPLILVLDDDARIRRALDTLLRSVGHRTALYESALDLLEAPLPPLAGCLLMDVRLPRMSGLELQARLAERGEQLPVVFMTGYGDVPMSVKAMKAGAVDFLIKPFRDQDLLDAVDLALGRDRERRQAQAALSAARALHATLTPREAQVMTLVTAGLMNKQVAGELGLSEITVKLHRSSLMRKLGTRSLAELVRLAQRLGV